MLGAPDRPLTPSELISVILRAPVDLLWNGGIGTYVKASGESNAEVGDRANDSVRVNADELRCRMVAEGGNLGLTQRARVEYALGGGLVNTDAIDNSAGVDCSDHEVNIKILLGDVIASGEMTLKQRNQLLDDMTEEVAEQPLSKVRSGRASTFDPSARSAATHWRKRSGVSTGGRHPPRGALADGMHPARESAARQAARRWGRGLSSVRVSR